MANTLLHVVSFTLGAQADIDDVLRHLRRIRGCAHTLLLFADFHAASAVRLPGDEPLLRRLQSGVMAMNARKPGQFLLLARRRVWDDAARAYLGAEQALSCREVIAQLLESGKTQAVFDAATCSPASLKGRFSAVLFSDLALACTPDTPARMLDALERTSVGCVCAPVRSPRLFPETVFSRLVRTCGFSLSPLRAAREALLEREGRGFADGPSMYTSRALIASLSSPAKTALLAGDCFFMRVKPLVLPQLFAAHRLHAMRHPDAKTLVPPIQLALLFLSALLGLPLLSALALLPEALCVLRPRLLPGALLRTALLPLTAAVTLDALLCRLFARAKLLRLYLPDVFITSQGCMLAGAALLPAALVSARALVPLLPICLLWLCAPLLLPALASPTLERIPLEPEQKAQLRTLAESAFFDAAKVPSSPPALRMLVSCGGCMLGVLEPDEAARQAQTILELEPAIHSAAEHAALLVCAQFFRERMADCDATLRALPAQLESYVRARTNRALPFHSAGTQQPLDALFLPLAPAKSMAQHAATLPLTHPHTFFRRRLLLENAAEQAGNPVEFFLGLAAAALDHPFHALLMRSPVAAPYMPLLYC